MAEGWDLPGWLPVTGQRVFPRLRLGRISGRRVRFMFQRADGGRRHWGGSDLAEAETNLFIGLSWAPGSEAEPVRRLLARLERIVGGWWRVARPGRLVCAQPSAFRGTDERSPLCMTTPLAVSRAGRACGPDAVFEHLDRGEEARSMAAPFAAVWLDPGTGSLRAGVDAFAIGQLFAVETEHISAVSNSATLLARVFERGLDARALVGFSLFGAFHGGHTPFEGVGKIGPDQAIEFRDARPRGISAGRPATAPSTSVDELTERLRSTVIRLSDAAPDADLQLSGGLDSRLILAALPPERRRRHRAVTIGAPEAPDVRIAAAICERLGLRHEVVDVAVFDDLDADGLHRLLRRAARGFDCSANPLDKAALLMAEREADSRIWFNGQNGEILRGFYYPGQALGAAPSAARARRLLSWRLAANDLVDERLFNADVYPELRSRAEAEAVNLLCSFEGAWSASLDRFYLHERMQRWAGNGIDNLINRTGYLCPFFDRGVVETALALPHDLKRHGRAAFMALSTLDRDLADMPLDSGMRPLAIVESPLRARSAELVHFAKKAAGRIKRKLTGERRAALGSDAAALLWSRHELNARLPFSAMAATGLFDRHALEEVVTGRWLPDRPTLGFVLMAAELSEIG